MNRVIGITGFAALACIACCSVPILAALGATGGAAILGGVTVGWWGAGVATLLAAGGAALVLRYRSRARLPAEPAADISGPPPIACTLTGGDFNERIAWIADLNRTALRSHRRRDLELTLSYDPAVIGQLRELVAKEQACCAFLAFDLVERPDAIELTITAPEEARAAAETVFEQFTASVPAKVGCGCC